jgi:hypothetical protein
MAKESMCQPGLALAKLPKKPYKYISYAIFLEKTKTADYDSSPNVRGYQ